jgi:uncharacterized protein (DUF302 family)
MDGIAVAFMESVMNQVAGIVSSTSARVQAFIRGEATLTVVCDGSFDEVAARLEASIAANGMSVVQVHDFDRLLAAKGIVLDVRSRVYEVWNPRLAARLFAIEPDLSHLLPCRIAMHDERGLITVTVPMPTAVMTEFSHAASVAALARDFEAGLQRVLRALR